MKAKKTRAKPKRYPSDLTRNQWKKLKRLLPPAKPGGRPRSVNLREVLNGIFYIARGGGSWRMMPKDLPPWSTCYDYFRKWRDDGTWSRANDALRTRVRHRSKRKKSPSLGIIDTQSVKTTEQGGPRGKDAHKKVNGRKRHLVVDTLGMVVAAVVHSAGIQDRDGSALVLDRIRQRFPWLELVWADSGYNAHQVKDVVAKSPGLRLEIVKRTDDMKGFVVLPRRWVVERTFSWFGRNRRLAKDYETLADTLAAFVTLAAIQFALRRLARA